jgi:hypothetical protein
MSGAARSDGTTDPHTRHAARRGGLDGEDEAVAAGAVEGDGRQAGEMAWTGLGRGEGQVAGQRLMGTGAGARGLWGSDSG